LRSPLYRVTRVGVNMHRHVTSDTILILKFLLVSTQDSKKYTKRGWLNVAVVRRMSVFLIVCWAKSSVFVLRLFALTLLDNLYSLLI
jgi:hypothetical protein